MPHLTHPRFWLALAFVALLLVCGRFVAGQLPTGGSVAAALLRATSVPSDPAPGLTPVTAVPVTAQPDTLAPTEAVAGDATLAPTSVYGPARQAIFDRIATDRAQPPGPKGPNYSPTPYATLAITPRRGIINEVPNPMKGVIYAKNMWIGHVQGQSVQIRAGAWYDDSRLGMIMIWIGDIGDPGSTSETYFTPIRAGAVHLIAANETGTLLTLEAEDGSIFVLDRTRGQFVDQPPSHYPTATPGPSPVVYPAPIS